MRVQQSQQRHLLRVGLGKPSPMLLVWYRSIAGACVAQVSWTPRIIKAWVLSATDASIGDGGTPQPHSPTDHSVTEAGRSASVCMDCECTAVTLRRWERPVLPSRRRRRGRHRPLHSQRPPTVYSKPDFCAHGAADDYGQAVLCAHASSKLRSDGGAHVGSYHRHLHADTIANEGTDDGTEYRRRVG